MGRLSRARLTTRTGAVSTREPCTRARAGPAAATAACRAFHAALLTGEPRFAARVQHRLLSLAVGGSQAGAHRLRSFLFPAGRHPSLEPLVRAARAVPVPMRRTRPRG